MKLFFEQVDDLTRTSISAFEGEPLLAFCLIVIIIGGIFFICGLCGITPKHIWNKMKKIWKNIDASFDEPEELKPMINALTNRDFVIEMLRLRKETIEKDGYDPMCPPYATKAEQLAAEKVATALERLVNEYPDPDEFNKALSNEKFYINKEN